MQAEPLPFLQILLYTELLSLACRHDHMLSWASIKGTVEDQQRL